MRSLALGAGLAAAAVLTPNAAFAAPPATIDARLAIRAAAAPDETLAVWVAFRDKGEPAEVARRLERAEVELTPRARARRLRAGVAPLVDEGDLPVEPRYLEGLRGAGLQPFAASKWLNRAAVRVPGRIVPELATLPFVAGLEAVARVRRSAPEPAPLLRSPDRPLVLRAGVDYGLQQAMLEQIGAPALHDSGYTGGGTLIAVFDEGFNGHEQHEALLGQTPAPGRRCDFVERDTVVTDPGNPFSMAHGTWTFGVLAGNLPGTYVGSAFGAEYALARTEVRVTEQAVEMLYWSQAAEWADSLGADIISSSVGYFTFDNPADNYVYGDMDGATTDVTRAARFAAARGILVVNSVGNEGDKPWHYLIAPSDVHGDSLIAVGAVDASGFVAAFSSYGPSADGRVKPDLAACGVGNPLVDSTSPGGYLSMSGTSFSAPLVAGLAACLWQARPSWSAVDVIRALRETASRAGSPNDRVGYGVPSGAAALCWRAGAPPPVPGKAVVLGPNPMRGGGPPVRVRLIAGGVQAGSQKGRVRVLDLGGRELAELWSGGITRGQCVDVSWDGRDRDGRRTRPGIYYIALSAGGDVVSARVVSLQ